ncbi:MAG TPA: hypothetical protein DCK87_02995 [Desulfotomaculum sp.]|nr:hypothetical protein [Desulfotomaculum sp.]
MGKGLFTKALATFLIITFAGGFIFIGGASAQTLTPLQDSYQGLVGENKDLFNRLLKTNLVNEDQIYLFVVDLESELSNRIINQANADKVIKDVTIDEILNNQAVFNAVNKAYSKEITKYFLTGKLPADIAGLLSQVKTILLTSVVVAWPSGGDHPSCTGVGLNSYVKGVSFYYTLSNSQPTTATKKYAGNLSLPGRTGPVELKAIAWKNGVSSDVATFNYEITGNPCQGGIRGYVNLEGVNQLNNGDYHTGVTIKVVSDRQETGSYSAAPDGSYSVNDLCPGKYTINLQPTAGTWKGVELPVTLTDCKVVEVQTVTLWVGDMTGDQQINILDLLWMATMIDRKPGDQGWEEGKKADVNGDGSVNILDLLRVAKNIGK